MFSASSNASLPRQMSEPIDGHNGRPRAAPKGTWDTRSAARRHLASDNYSTTTAAPAAADGAGDRARLNAPTLLVIFDPDEHLGRGADEVLRAWVGQCYGK